jgi:hypothetical protein
VTHASDDAQAAGIVIVLYALSPDGTPGLANGQTNAEGVHQFSNISTDPGIVYLIGARYENVPFGERITFAAGETNARVEIEIMSPTQEVTGVTIEELRLRIDWMGDRVLVREVLRVKNASERVIRLSPEETQDPTKSQGARAIFTRRLDENAADFSSGPNGVDNGLVLEGGSVRFLGPLYPGEQSVEYRYSLPIPSEGRSFKLPVELASAAAQVVVVAGTAGLEIEGAELVASSPVRSDNPGTPGDSGQTFEAWARAGLAAGERFELTLTLPESRRALGLLTIPRSDLSIRFDDTQLTATVTVQIVIAPGAPVAGTPAEPLLRVVIPDGATLQGVAPEAEALGLIFIDGGGFDVVGPIGSGTTSLGYSYRMPVERGGVRLEMRFPAKVETLNVLIEDNGVALDSSRLHRRRPVRIGTLNYLHRQAYNVEKDEVVDLEFVLLTDTGVPRTASIVLTIAAAGAGAFFMFSPLRTPLRRETEDVSPKAAFQAKREAVYTAIADLDHDFETAKLEEADYTKLRERLRREAIELLRAERAATSTPTETRSTGNVRIVSTSPGGSVRPGGPAASDSSSATTGVFCPSCGGQVTTAWRFCSHCGGHLNPPEEASG